MTNLRRLASFSILLILTAGTVLCESPIETRAQRIAEVLQIHPGSIVADVGAGDGEWTVELAKAVGEQGRVHATEVSDTVLAKLKKTVENSGLHNVTVVRGDQNRTGLDPDCCDAVLLRHVYHHFADPKAMLADLLESLRPGGLLAVIDFSPDNALSKSSVPEFRHGHGVQAGTVEDEIRKAGFELVRRQDRWDGRREEFMLLFQKPSGY